MATIAEAAGSIGRAIKRAVRGSGSRKSKRARSRDLTAHAESIVIDEVTGMGRMALRPNGTTAHVESEFAEYANEQFDKHHANGIRESRPAHEEAASVTYRAHQAEARVEVNKPRMEAARADRDHAWHWLLQFTRRPVGAHRLYLRWFLLLMLGDGAGVFGAAVMWGEMVPVAVGQALSSGAAAVAAGWVGADVREQRDAATRARLAATGDLPDDLVGRYPALFAQPVPERSTYGLALGVAAVIVCCLTAAIFALRSAVEGSLLAGLIFGGLAAATALGSFVNSWRHADAISDLLERVDLAYARAVAEDMRLLADPAISRRDAALTRAAQIEAHHLKLASAAKHGVVALLHGVLRRNPEIFGHGSYSGGGAGQLRPPRLDAIPDEIPDWMENEGGEPPF